MFCSMLNAMQYLQPGQRQSAINNNFYVLLPDSVNDNRACRVSW